MHWRPYLDVLEFFASRGGALSHSYIRILRDAIMSSNRLTILGRARGECPY